MTLTSKHHDTGSGGITPQKGSKKTKVTTYTINKGQPTQYFGLKNAEDNQVLYGAPNSWKTEKGAIRWAMKNGMEVVK